MLKIINEAYDATFNDKYFPRIPSNAKRLKYGDRYFWYNIKDSTLHFIFQDEDEVEELGKNAPWRSIDSINLNKEEWDDNPEYWMSYYSNEIDDEVSNIDFTEFDINESTSKDDKVYQASEHKKGRAVKNPTITVTFDIECKRGIWRNDYSATHTASLIHSILRKEFGAQWMDGYNKGRVLYTLDWMPKSGDPHLDRIGKDGENKAIPTDHIWLTVKAPSSVVDRIEKRILVGDARKVSRI